MTQRSENRIEVPGTPEQVWEAIATGHGTETWFVPAEIEGRRRRQGPPRHGRPGWPTRASSPTGSRRTASPTRSSGRDEAEGTLATEFLVEAQSGGTCIVRLVTTVHATGGDWDDMLENLAAGWDGYLLILKTYLSTSPASRAAR